jgi:hypothetical protein
MECRNEVEGGYGAVTRLWTLPYIFAIPLLSPPALLFRFLGYRGFQLWAFSGTGFILFLGQGAFFVDWLGGLGHYSFWLLNPPFISWWPPFWNTPLCRPVLSHGGHA